MSQPDPVVDRQTVRTAEGGKPDLPERLAVSPDLLVGGFPGPALLVAAGGRVVAYNRPAEALMLAFADPNGSFASTARTVAATRRPVQERFRLPDDLGAAVIDLTLVPFDGDHVAVLGRDSTLEDNLTTALIASRQMFKELVACSADFAWETDASGAFSYVSPRGALGFTPQELFGRAARGFIADRDHAPADFPFEAREALDGVETWCAAKDGTRTCLIVSCRPVFDAADRWAGARGVCHDATLERRQQAALERAASRAEMERRIIDSIRNEIEPGRMLAVAAEATMTAFESGRICILRVDPAGGMDRVAEATPGGDPVPERIWRVAGDALSASPRTTATIELEIAGHRLLAAHSEHRGVLNGGICAIREPERAPWSDDERTLVASVAAHLGIAIAQIESFEALARLSRTDGLTGLLNRRAFIEDLARRLAHQSRKSRTGTLLYIDLDNFKLVNDRLGHHRGDEVLRAFGRILRERSRAGDLAVRLGGDEFALWLEETGLEGARVKAERLCALGRELSSLTGETAFAISVSIGIAVSNPRSRETVDELIARADGAMYRAKRDGKDAIAVADEETNRSDSQGEPSARAETSNPGAE